jgi:hypothetical protein
MAWAAPVDLCDPANLSPALLKTLTPAERKCVWRRLKKMGHQVKAYEGFLFEVNDYGSNFDAKAYYQQSLSARGKRGGSLKEVAASGHRASKQDLELWNRQMAGLKAIPSERVFIASVEAFEGRQLIRCDHLSLEVIRYSEWLDSKTGLVLRAAGFNEQGRLFFARIYSHVRIGQALGPESKFGRKQIKALEQRLSKQRLEKAEDAEAYVAAMNLNGGQ